MKHKPAADHPWRSSFINTPRIVKRRAVERARYHKLKRLAALNLPCS